MKTDKQTRVIITKSADQAQLEKQKDRVRNHLLSICPNCVEIKSTKERSMNKYKCPKCSFEYSAQDWDHSTLRLCVNRELRRKYISINESQGKSLYYKCPNCDSNVKAKFIEREIK